jgi:CDP-diacylglycerol---serine O-phosphatidyltransferase
MGFQAWKSIYMLLVMFAIAAAMISTIRYRSFKDLSFRSQKNFGILFVSILIFILISTAPERVLFPMIISYLVSGAMAETTRFLRRHYRWIPGTGRS